MAFRIALLLVCSVSIPHRPTIGAEPTELLIRNARIVTVDPEFRIVEAMAIRNERVVGLGTAQEVRDLLSPMATVVDLEGKMVLPGLIDSHTHPSGASMFESDHPIPSMESISDVLAYVRTRAAAVPRGEWIKISQVFITRLREQRYPTRKELDEVAPHHPVMFRTGPDGSLNSLALQENGIDAAFAAEHPDHVMVDQETGEPNGIIRQAASLLKSIPDTSSGENTASQRDERMRLLFEDYCRVGITGIIDRNCDDRTRNQYARLLEKNQLPLRVRMSRSLNPRGSLEEIERRLDEISADPLFRQPQPRLATIGVKCFQDGGMLTGSAYFNRPWGISSIYGIDDPAYRGLSFIETERTEQIVRACVQRGLAFTAHCQGDAAVELLLSVYERVNRDHPIQASRPTLTHSSFMSQNAIATATELGVGVDLQPAWLYLDARTLLAQFGEARLKYFIPLRSLMEAGIHAGGGSDHMQKIGSLRSVNPYNPFLGMWIAATRQARWHDAPVHPEQALSREQMIRFYTINNAWLMHMESEIGSLEVGKRADFIVLDRDLLTCPDEKIRSTQVLSTWVDGEPIHSM